MQRRHDPRQDGLEQPARRNAGDDDALGLQLFGQRRIDARGDKGRLSARQLVLQLALDRILADGDLGDAALGDELLEFAVGNGVDRIVGRQHPLQHHHADAGRKDIADGDGLLS